MQDRLRLLPSLHVLLERRAVKALLRRYRRDVVAALARESLDAQRERLRKSDGESPTRQGLLRACEADLLERIEALEEPKLRRVINATGVLLHTNLGRARLAEEVADEVRRVAVEGVPLEIDLESNRRGGRSARVQRWLRLLTGAPAAAAVNNGAAALWLSVRACVRSGRQVVVARGEQVAIGGSFRMPELTRTTGAKVVDVGTTNRTTVADYAAVVGEGDVVLKVHPSNYRIEGFTEEASLAELSALCRERAASLIFDAGSGSLYNFGQFGLSGEYGIAESLRAGADLVTFSGDKLLGGPQAGLVVGRTDLVERVARHPLMRALRLDKMVLAALEATLATYARTPTGARPDLPLFDALGAPVAALRRRARAVAEALAPHTSPGWEVAVVRSHAAMGGGSFAQNRVASIAVDLSAPTVRRANSLHRRLRTGRPAVLAAIDEATVRLDLRSVAEHEDETLIAAVRAALGSES